MSTTVTLKITRDAAPSGNGDFVQALAAVSGLEKYGGGDVESFAQSFYVGFVEGAFLVEDFGHDAFGAKDGHQVFLAKIMGLHQRLKDFDGRGIEDGVMLFFVGLDQRDQDFGIFLFFRGWVGFACELVEDGKILFVLALGGDGRWRANRERVLFGNSDGHFRQSFWSSSAWLRMRRM
jgi:hypothetical protein